MIQTNPMRRAQLEAELKEAKNLLPKLRQDVEAAKAKAIPQLRRLISLCEREIADLHDSCNFVATDDLSNAMRSVSESSEELDEATYSLESAERDIADMESDLSDLELWKGDAA